MRCTLSNRKVYQLRRETGLDVIMAFTRGGWGHYLKLVLRSGACWWYKRGQPLEPNPSEQWEVTPRLITKYGLPKGIAR